MPTHQPEAGASIMPDGHEVRSLMPMLLRNTPLKFYL